ncbi:hypothetical protein BDM02DRAFT_553409 [Thelephora ganbajun]|uniref:Uncharacterized protein n=1 Tax=Thelephora ganbajun TaxID=370292 RepID=A0ACB6ZPX3_THEGA|nr:hypothetical protein BDM02DRAFT_553409 [Thelephora ganbajun]
MSGPSISTDSLSLPHVNFNDHISTTPTSQTPSSSSSGHRRHREVARTLTAAAAATSNDLALDRVQDSKRSSKVPERFRKERERVHSERTTKQLIRLLIHEEYETKQAHILLHAAFERLESEARRVNEAEERVLEIAQRFNAVNEARVQAQAEAAKLNAELALYKLQLENAQQEIYRAQDIVRKVEDERDDAAAEATEARDTARKYREEHIVHLAKEEGRKLGYLQGIRHAQVGYVGTKTIDFPDHYTTDAIPGRRLLMDEPFDDTLQNVFDDEESITDDGISTVLSRPLYMSRNTARDVELTSNAPRQSQAASHHPTLGSNGPTTRVGRSPTDDTFPVHVHNGFPTTYPAAPVPPDGWIPRSEDGSRIAVPPPHEFDRGGRVPSSTPGRSWTGIQNRLNKVFGTSRHTRQQSDAPNVAAPVPSYPRSSPTPPSPPSTTFSQFDITATEPDLSEDARRKLSVIQEGSVEATPSVSVGRSRAENVRTPALETDYGYSPTTNFTIRSPPGGEDPVALMDVIKSHPHKSGPGGGDYRPTPNMQRLADDLRYSDPDLVESWRRSTANAAPIQNTYSPPRRRPQNLTTPVPLSPSTGLTPHSLPRNSSASSNIGIGVEPPTDSDAYGSQQDHTPAPGMLSPLTIPSSLQPAPYRQQSPRMMPLRTGSPAVGHNRPGTLRPESPVQLSPLERDPRDKRRMRHESTSRSGSPYRTPASIPPPPPGA